MQKRKYGKLGYEVSALGMGCMRLPRIYKDDGTAIVDREKAYEIIRYAADNGVTYFDTAYTYHNMDSEAVLGEALEGSRREKVKIVTKQPFAVMKTKDDIRRNLENTLKKLRTDHIDIYLIHNIQSGSWEEIKQREIYKEYEKFRSEGMIRAIGFSYHGGFDAFQDILGYYPWDMCQIQQNMLDVDDEVTERGIKAAGEKGIALAIMEPLRGGGLANPPASVQKMYDSYSTDRSPVEWAFRHLLDYPEVGCILSGMTTLEQLKQNIDIFSKSDAVSGCLSGKEKEIIAQARKEYNSLVAVPCTACEYCMPCPQGVAIPSVMGLYNDGKRFGDFSQPQRSYMFISRGGRDASRCAECGICEEKCPQHIEIIKSLKEAHESLKGWIE